MRCSWPLGLPRGWNLPRKDHGHLHISGCGKAGDDRGQHRMHETGVQAAAVGWGTWSALVGNCHGASDEQVNFTSVLSRKGASSSNTGERASATWSRQCPVVPIADQRALFLACWCKELQRACLKVWRRAGLASPEQQPSRASPSCPRVSYPRTKFLEAGYLSGLHAAGMAQGRFRMNAVPR